MDTNIYKNENLSKLSNENHIQYLHCVMTLDERDVLALLDTYCQVLGIHAIYYAISHMLLQKVIAFWLPFETTIDIQNPV